MDRADNAQPVEEWGRWDDLSDFPPWNAMRKAIVAGFPLTPITRVIPKPRDIRWE